MTKLAWDQTGQRRFEAGTNKGVLFPQNTDGSYQNGVAWNGLTAVTESPSGAEANPQYADNMKYLNIKSAEEYGFTIEAFTYPSEFGQCDGTAEPAAGVFLGQQSRRSFGFTWQTRIGNDTQSTDLGYKIHLAWGCDAAPSEKAHTTINESPEATGFSWEVTTNPVEVGEVGGVEYKPSAWMAIDSTTADETALAALEDLLYGTTGADPTFPTPAQVIEMFQAGTLTEVETVTPTYDPGTDIITIPSVTGVVYSINGEVVPAGPYGPITEDTVVTAAPAAGYYFTDTSDTDWTVNFS